VKCPHCLEGFFENWNLHELGEDGDGMWYTARCKCPNCQRFVIRLEKNLRLDGVGRLIPGSADVSILIRPKGITRTPLSGEVPEDFTFDYKEACLVLADSPKASAALSRRCLQHLLREKAQVKRGNLSDEIEQVIKLLPSYLAESIDAVRTIGNFAAHPMKSTNTGEIIDVEPGEAEWLLDVLEGLFDFYFVQPAILQKKRCALNAKLKQAGKPELK